MALVNKTLVLRGSTIPLDMKCWIHVVESTNAGKRGPTDSDYRLIDEDKNTGGLLLHVERFGTKWHVAPVRPN